MPQPGAGPGSAPRTAACPALPAGGAGPGLGRAGASGGAALSRLALTNPCKACDVPGLDRTVFHRVLRPASWAR